MEQLARIEAHLHSLQELGELVGALRSMAAARAREAQEAFEGTRAYSSIVGRAIAGIAPLLVQDGPAGGRAAGPDSADGPAPRDALVLVTSENGFVGGFNTALVERSAALRRTDERLVVAGRRGQIAAAERGIAPDHAFAMTSRVKGVTALARGIAERIAGARRVRLVYACYRPGGAFEVTERQVLPLDAADFAAPAPDRPLHHLPPGALMSELAEEHLFAEIAHALMESLAAENGARLGTMDAAARNIEKKLDRLRRDERVARQEKTTADMLDVVTGAEAVNHG